MNASPQAPYQEPRFPLPQRHRRLLACIAVLCSVALGTFGVGATVETVDHGPLARASAGK
ncbi:hypothetical protein ACFQ6N_06255 [Kitasatospora sp. NPDC056446]|uniref:hypothetical protein n=1 Tax=Kitasatospora sp. NPDC056446 TaxID=3345819 RepID=UPI0036B4FD48